MAKIIKPIPAEFILEDLDIIIERLRAIQQQSSLWDKNSSLEQVKGEIWAIIKSIESNKYQKGEKIFY